MADPVVRRVLLVLASSGGGTRAHVAQLARGLAGEGLEVTVAAPAATLAALDLPPSVRRALVDVVASPRPARDLAAVGVLRALARPADVVHAHGMRAGALAVVAVRSLRPRPAVVVTSHNAAVGGPGVRAVHALLGAVVARGADAVLGVSGDLVAELRARGARDAARALVPAPPLPPPSRSATEVRAALEVPDGAALLVTAARLAPQKGVHVLADAVDELARRRPDLPVVAVVAGEGPLEAALRRRAVRLLGRRGDVTDLLAAADLVVVPSRWEGQPLIVQEALRAGAAIVATDAGGTREVAGTAVRFVPAGDAPALAAALEELLDDPPARAGLRAAAVEQAARLPSAAEALAQIRGLYGRVVAARPGR